MKEGFSVSMCVYHGDDAANFQTAVESVLAQTCLPEEVVLVVDGPVPAALEEVISAYEKNPLFRVLWLEKNCGHGAARRAGLEACRCELVALMDADDICVPERFALQTAAFAAHPEACVIGGQIEEFIGTPQQTVGKRVVPLTDGEIKAYLKKRCPFNQVAVMLRKQAVNGAGGYLDWYCDEDYYLWLRLFLAGGCFANVPETLVMVRVSEDMYARRGGWKYFCSESRLQRFMLKNGIVSLPLYCVNVLKRLVVQVLLPNRVRGWIFQNFARE